MSAPALEKINIAHASTYEILLGIQQGLLTHAEAIDDITPDWQQHGIVEQRFFSGDNAFVRVGLEIGRMSVNYSSHLPALFGGEKLNPIELKVTYDANSFGIEPTPLTDGDSFAVTTSSAHSANRQEYRPKSWPDGGWSLELVSPEVGPSLDQGTIARMVEFANEMAGAELILVKERH